MDSLKDLGERLHDNKSRDPSGRTALVIGFNGSAALLGHGDDTDLHLKLRALQKRGDVMPQNAAQKVG